MMIYRIRRLASLKLNTHTPIIILPCKDIIKEIFLYLIRGAGGGGGGGRVGRHDRQTNFYIMMTIRTLWGAWKPDI